MMGKMMVAMVGPHQKFHQIPKNPLDQGWDYHDGEDDGSHGGFEDPEHSQADDLHQGEEVDAAQRDMPQEHVVGLVLGRHQEELAAIPELPRVEDPS